MNWKAILIIFLSLIVTETTFATDKKKKITISGYVKDSNGKPLQGVSIIIDETTLNKVTDKKGFYKIKVNPNIKTLTVYSIYYGGADVEFTGKTKISFILAAIDSDNPKFSNPEELIDVGYSTEKKSKTSNGSSTINKESPTSPNYKNIYEMIQGQVSGVTVVGKSIQIRGQSSIMSGTQPLFIVDGIEVFTIDNINPNDVKSISILKGADTAMYGSKGANGVILIRTKK